MLRSIQNLRAKEKSLQFPDVTEKMEYVDMKRGSKVAGHRGYFLIKELALLAKYDIDFLQKKDYKLIQAPVLK